MSLCSSDVKLFWRWVMVTLAWMLGFAVLTSHYLPQQVPARSTDPFTALAEMGAAISWVAIVTLGGLLAQYGLVISTPLWLVSEVVAWRAKTVQDRLEEQRQLERYIQEQNKRGDHESVKSA